MMKTRNSLQKFVVLSKSDYLPSFLKLTHHYKLEICLSHETMQYSTSILYFWTETFDDLMLCFKATTTEFVQIKIKITNVNCVVVYKEKLPFELKGKEPALKPK